ncbi:MAG: hypothetical protein JNL28_05085 [Planctomycetes bacterium]|nr:hypothetical protein [Planctomycetota bacterium]
MKIDKNIKKSTAALAAALGLMATGVSAQSLMVTDGTIIMVTGDQVPGLTTGIVFGGSTPDSGSLDEAGNVFFRARFQGAGVLPTDDRALFLGKDRSSLAIAVRANDPVPGVAGAVLASATSSASGPGSGTRLAANGQMFWPSGFSGGTTTTADDSGLFTGTIGNFVIAAREGDPVPGVAGAVFSGGIGALSHQGTGMNDSGRILFKTSLSGGPVTTADNQAWVGGTAGNLEIMFRKGHTLGSGEVVSALGFISQQNASGAFIHEETLSTSLGATPATLGTDKVLFIYTPGGTPGTGTNTLVAREGDGAPGTVGAFLANASNTWSPSMGASAFNNNGVGIMNAALSGGDVVVGQNDAMTYYVSIAGGLQPFMRKGDPATGTDGVFLFAHTSNTIINNNDVVAFQGAIIGGTSTTDNDSGIWIGTPGNLTLIAREGDPAPGTVGAAYGSFSGLANFYLNDRNQVTFQCDLIGGDAVPGTNGSALYAWDPNLGVKQLLRQGDMIETAPSVFKTASSWGGIQFSNGNGGGLSLNHAGRVALRINFPASEAAIMTVEIPGLTGSSFCDGDGTGTACPCANSGIAGHGCANFNFSDGARLTAAGLASIANDTLVLTATNVPGPGLFFQGTGQFAGGAGITFGDGLLCAGGTILRLGVVFPTGTSASYPGGLTPGPIHIGGATAASDVRHYQCWYRDAGETSPGISFCTPATYNLTQGWTVTWTN